MTITTNSATSRAATSALTATTAVAAAAWYAYYHTRHHDKSKTQLEQAQHNANNNNNINRKPPVDVNLMDKLSRKVYLNPSRSVHKHGNHDPAVVRPKGVPLQLRILAIDLPELQTQSHLYFRNGTCTALAYDRVFPNGVARPNQVQMQVQMETHGSDIDILDKNNDNKNSNKQHSHVYNVEQKAWVHALSRCMYHTSNDYGSSVNNDNDKEDEDGIVGVEIMQASFAALNPHNMRKTRQLGQYKYDPGTYTNSNSNSMAGDSGGISTDTATTSPQEQQLDPEDIPWNQHAWMEEVKLRVSSHYSCQVEVEYMYDIHCI
jgi:hypothetical protein